MPLILLRHFFLFYISFIFLLVQKKTNSSFPFSHFVCLKTIFASLLFAKTVFFSSRSLAYYSIFLRFLFRYFFSRYVRKYNFLFFPCLTKSFFFGGGVTSFLFPVQNDSQKISPLSMTRHPNPQNSLSPYLS